MSRERLTGWGRTNPSVAEVVTPADEEAIAAAMAGPGPVVARGLGRSYGDAAQVGGGVVLSNLGLGGVGPIGADGVVSVGAGVSVDELLARSIPQGWFIPVTPGTRQVTLGGALAADVHGKNHHVDSSIGAHVTEMRLVTPSGALTVSPSQDPDLFWATIGGMGLTGVVTRLSLRMLAIETDRVLVDTDRFDDLDGVMAAMAEGDRDYRYSVSWVDCMTRGAHMGRAILTRGDHARAGDVAEPSLAGPRAPRLAVPFDAPSGLLNSLSVRAFNEVWFRSAPRHEVAEAQSLSTFFHPLDGVRDWNRLYGRRGFVQYQFCVSDEHAETVVRAIERLSSSRVPSFLAVLKRFGAPTPGPLSFPAPGWTLALDLPVGPAALPGVLDDLDEMVIEAGGRVYFAKDARLDPGKVRAMYPRLEEFLAIKDRVDPENRVTSDLARRLALRGV
ncbi:MAG: FAD-binding oxidoreductase [Acidobacteriota bacterium]|nr:FAD-binding oxidoreductase [Acidobacteriota bacterium]